MASSLPGSRQNYSRGRILVGAGSELESSLHNDLFRLDSRPLAPGPRVRAARAERIRRLASSAIACLEEEPLLSGRIGSRARPTISAGWERRGGLGGGGRRA